MRALTIGAVVFATAFGVLGCKHPEVTAVPLSRWNADEPQGIPFYLPKPLLIISKNFRYLEEPKVGLTDGAPIPHGFDDQAKYADVNARTNFTAGTTTPSPASPTSSGASASPPRLHSGGAPLSPGKMDTDGLAPETFYTYQIVFVPDLTQKYGLKIKGGAGELRAAMNLVNGWQYTGLGPFYMKDSSSAQNVLATGITANLAATGVADIVDSVANLAGKLQTGERAVDAGAPEVQRVVKTLQSLETKIQPICLPNFAEIHVYEPRLTPDGRMEWCEIAGLTFDRTVLAKVATIPLVPPPKPKTDEKKDTTATEDSRLQSGVVDANFARQVVARTMGIPFDSAALQASETRLQSGTTAVTPAVTPAGSVNQIHVECGGCRKAGCRKCDAKAQRSKHRLFGLFENVPRPKIERRRVVGAGLFPLLTGEAGGPPKPAGLGGQQSGETGRVVLQQPVLNQPLLIQPKTQPAPQSPKKPID